MRRLGRKPGAAVASALLSLAAGAAAGGAQVPPTAPPPAPPVAPAPSPVPADTSTRADTVPADTVAADTVPADTVPVPPARSAPEADLRSAWRFELADVGDSTFRFGVGGLRWLKPGARGIVVDPRQRDALVARFEVQSVATDTAEALVVGQTQRVVPDHVALVTAPPVKPWRQRSFWQGVTTGALTAAVLTAIGFLAFH